MSSQEISHSKQAPPRIDEEFRDLLDHLETVSSRNNTTTDHLEAERSSSKREIASLTPICSVESLTASESSWIIQVKNRFCTLQYKKGQPSHVCIYRVPATIRSPKPAAYVPLVASFGPYHHHHPKTNEHLYAIDDYKLEAVQRTIERSRGLTINKLIAEVQNLEEEIRNCYKDSAKEYSKETLCWMFTMDACFILEIFRTSVTKSPKQEDTTKPAKEEERAKKQEPFSMLFEYNGRQNIFRYEIMRDIMKLENQIPLFVLRKILALQSKNEDEVLSKLVTSLFPLPEFRGFPFSFPSSYGKIEENKIDDKIRSSLRKHINGASHLLDLSRRVIKDILTYSCSESTASATNPTDDLNFPKDDGSTPSAEKLHKSVIIFKPSNTGEVKFEGRYFLSSTFYFPEITVDDDTEILLRNLIAFEECQGCRLSSEPTVISNYLHLMDELIDTSVDVGLLKQGRVIKSLVGSDEEIAATINDLCKGITDSPYQPYKEVVKKVRAHLKSRPKVWLGQFRQERCSKPWYIISLVAAALLLGLAAVQTIFTVKK